MWSGTAAPGGARLGPVHQQADPLRAEVLVGEKAAVDARPHQDLRDRAPIDERHLVLSRSWMSEAELRL
jgi:hypothetical protein